MVAYLSYFLLFSIPFTALGIACVILGAATVTLPENPVPKRAVRSVIKAAVLNVEALLEEFDAKEKAIYLPPKDGVGVAYVPLAGDSQPPAVEGLMGAPRRLVAQVGGVTYLMVVPPGAELIKAGGVLEGSSVEDAFQYVLVDTSELCSSVKAVATGDTLVAEMKGVKVKTGAPKYEHSLGTIPASIGASVAAAVTQRKVTLVSEVTNRRESVVTYGLS